MVIQKHRENIHLLYSKRSSIEILKYQVLGVKTKGLYDAKAVIIFKSCR